MQPARACPTRRRSRSRTATRTRPFVDLERDVTVADVRRAVGAGLRSVEHVKRFTTIGTGSDQGKTANVNAIRVAAELLGVHPGELGTTTFRPPYTPGLVRAPRRPQPRRRCSTRCA